MVFNNGLQICFIYRTTLNADGTINLVYPKAFNAKILGIWCSAIFSNITSNIQTPPIIKSGYSLSSVSIMQDSYADQGGFVLVFGF